MDLKVVVFDDNKERRDSLNLLINSTDGVVCVDTFANCMNLEKDLKTSEPDVVLMDIDMPGINGIEAVKIIRKKFPKIQILMQTVFDEDEKIFQAICAGASGYILKKSSTDFLIEAIKEVHTGGAPMTPSVAKQVLQLFSKQANSKTEYHLTPREKEILQLLSKGKSYKMIAAELFITYHTVNEHVKRIYEKLHVNTATEAVSKAIQERLI